MMTVMEARGLVTGKTLLALAHRAIEGINWDDHFDVKYKQPLESKWLNVNLGFTIDSVHDLDDSQSPQALLPNRSNRTQSLLH